MKFSLIICTYQRPKPLLQLLQSVQEQTLYPDEILIIDGSTNEATQFILEQNHFQNVHYFLVPKEHRGLTKQRNFGIARVSKDNDVVCFLDDDTVLSADYFEQLLSTYQKYPDALGVGGYIHNETKWEFIGTIYKPQIDEFCFDGWKRKDGSRFVLRKKLGLDSDCPPGFSSLYSHGRSVGFLPPSGKIYEVEQLMGGVSSFQKKVFETHQFSTYFEGYGLYEDADFCLRVAKTGKLYLLEMQEKYKIIEPLSCCLRASQSISLWQNGSAKRLVCLAGEKSKTLMERPMEMACDYFAVDFHSI